MPNMHSIRIASWEELVRLAPVLFRRMQELKFIGQGTLIETIAMGLLATLFSTILAIPLSFLAAHNIMSKVPGGIVIYYAMRTLLNIVEVFLQVLTGDFEGAGQTIRGIVSRWWEFFRDAFNAIKRQITSIDWGGIGRSVVDGIWRGMQASWGGLQSWFDDRLQELRNQLPFSEPRDPDSPLRGLADSGAAIVDQIRSGIEAAGSLMAPGLGMQPAAMGGSTSAYSSTINVNGGDAGGVGAAARDGVLAGLRAAGVR
jgi:hypothetical protein